MAYLKFGLSFFNSRFVQYVVKKFGIVSFWTNRKNTLSYEAIQYIQTTGNRISEVKKNLHRVTKEKFPHLAGMMSTLHTGELIKTLVMLHKGIRGIEIGVFTGFSALCMAEALPSEGKLYALEINPEFIEFAKSFWIQAKVNEKIVPMVGDALQSLNKLLSDPSNLESFDFVFIDADKNKYVEYYEAALKLLKPKGIIIIDNVLLRGQVYIDKFVNERVEAVKMLNNLIRYDSRVYHCNMIGVDDGVSIVIKN